MRVEVIKCDGLNELFNFFSFVALTVEEIVRSTSISLPDRGLLPSTLGVAGIVSDVQGAVLLEAFPISLPSSTVSDVRCGGVGSILVGSQVPRSLDR